MRDHKKRFFSIWVAGMLLLPIALMPSALAWQAGDEVAAFGHTFSEEYWTNSSIFVESGASNATLTTSYVGVGEFSAFLIAFNEINDASGNEIIVPYQLFGMHYKTPGNKEVFIGAVFAFLLAHNETYGSNELPDVGNEPAWYVVPVANNNPWPEVTPGVEPIPATKLGENHYRFGMRYTNLPARIVAANESEFATTLIWPILTVLISEIVIQYDISIDDTGQVHAETLYTIGQVSAAMWLGLFPVEPSELLVPTMKISAVHYLSIFTSRYTVTRATDGNTIAAPTSTTPLDDDIAIKVGNDDERAFDIGLGGEYALINESTDPWTTVSASETALNTLLGARASDFVLIAWQAPLSVWLFAHMAYGLSAQVRAMYTGPVDLVAHAGTAFHNSQWWYGVTFPEWNGLRVEQDPVYVAYTNLAGAGGGGVFFLLILGVGVIGVIVLVRRR
ncbi:MAG: hypothetical protein ACXADO_11690 [Candidatus Thorarchaeota archaeon]|jgi:hypothetical protein